MKKKTRRTELELNRPLGWHRPENGARNWRWRPSEWVDEPGRLFFWQQVGAISQEKQSPKSLNRTRVEDTNAPDWRQEAICRQSNEMLVNL